MTTADDPDVLDVEFRELPAAPRRATTPAARRKSRSRAARREAAAGRRIGLQHLAFFRGYLEGLDLAELADQYLEFGRDARKAASTRTWLVTAFVAAARKRQDFATARLLAIRPAALAATPAADAPAHSTPSLDDFAAEHDPDGFYTEKELLDLFAARHAGANTDAGATLRRQQRNARLRARQMAALEALARLVVEDPRPEHHVLGWFDTAVALRL
ncbi:TPA: integrase, partial [Burkholderia vietnamiensis]|nr:integrase [Burkholderia vietnamiensis]